MRDESENNRGHDLRFAELAAMIALLLAVFGTAYTVIILGETDTDAHLVDRTQSNGEMVTRAWPKPLAGRPLRNGVLRQRCLRPLLAPGFPASIDGGLIHDHQG